MPPPLHPQPKTAAGIAARNALIIARRTQNWTIKQIAEEAHLSMDQVKKISADAKAHGEEMSLLRQDPVDIIEQVLSERQTDYALYTQAAVAAAEKENINALIGALNGRGQTSDRIVKLLQDTGKLPRELGTMRYVIDFRGIAREMVSQLQALKAGKTEIEQVESFFREMTRIGAPGGPVGIPGRNGDDISPA